MPSKRTVNILIILLSLLILLALLYAARCWIRRIALESAADAVSRRFFHGGSYEINYRQRTVAFAETDVELLKKYKLNGKVSLYFPVRFFELPWRTNLRRITVEGVHWDLDLQKKTVNGFKMNEFLKSVQGEFANFRSANGKIPAFMTVGDLNLTNPEGRTRKLAVKSIFDDLNDFYLLGIHAGDMKVNFLYNSNEKKVVGQYLAKQSDFEFFRLSFGIPEVFAMSGVENLSGQFCYDIAKRKLEYIRGSSDFGVQAGIKGSIFTLYGSRRGRISWEYLNPQNWHIELRNAFAAAPVRAGLYYFVISQNTLEKDALNFDGELEFNQSSFKNMFGLELDRRTSAIRHRIVGKWDMQQKTWELSRLDTQKRVPHVKLKWNDFDIAFQGQSFKLSGSGAQSDHFGFHYELEMGNVDLRDRRKNIIIGSQVKLEGDCILSLSGDTLEPVSTGSIICSVADGAVEQSRFLLKNIKLTFAPDTDGGNKYAFSVGEMKFGVPDFRSGVNLGMKYLDGRISLNEILLGVSEMNLKYGGLELQSRGNPELRGSRRSENFDVLLPGFSGRLNHEKVSVGKIKGKFALNKNNWSWDGVVNTVKIGKNIFNAESVQTAVKGDIASQYLPVCRNVSLIPHNWKFKNDWISCASPSSSFNCSSTAEGVWARRNLDLGQMIVNFRNREYILPEMTIAEVNHGQYADGNLKCQGTPCRFDITYTRKNNDAGIVLKSGSFESDTENIRGINGDVKFRNDNDFLSAAIRYAELKQNDRILENGNIKFAVSRRNGVELNGFDGTFAAELSKISYAGKNKRGENIFEVRNFPAKYIESTLGVPEGMLSGMFNGRISVSADDFYNPFKIQTFSLKNNYVARMRMGVLESFAQKGNSVEDCFAADALKDFFAKTLVLEYNKVGNNNILDIKALGKSTELLPYEFDIKERKLKRSKVALFNSEVEVIMKYIIKKP